HNEELLERGSPGQNHRLASERGRQIHHDRAKRPERAIEQRGKHSERGSSFTRVTGREERKPLSLRWDENVDKIGLTAQHLREPSFGSNARLGGQRRLQPIAVDQKHRRGTEGRERQRSPQRKRARARSVY